MLVLPPSRKEWKCGAKWINGELVQTSEGCGQLINQSLTEKYLSGKYKIINSENGQGGPRGQPHQCPKREARLDMKAYNQAQRNKGCPTCAEIFNGEFYPLCPNCFRFECNRCYNLQHWINDGIESKCNVCGYNGLSVRQVFWSYMRVTD